MQNPPRLCSSPSLNLYPILDGPPASVRNYIPILESHCSKLFPTAATALFVISLSAGNFRPRPRPYPLLSSSSGSQLPGSLDMRNAPDAFVPRPTIHALSGFSTNVRPPQTDPGALLCRSWIMAVVLVRVEIPKPGGDVLCFYSFIFSFYMSLFF